MRPTFNHEVHEGFRHEVAKIQSHEEHEDHECGFGTKSFVFIVSFVA
jgi:hypothetical protein